MKYSNILGVSSKLFIPFILSVILVQSCREKCHEIVLAPPTCPETNQCYADPVNKKFPIDCNSLVISLPIETFNCLSKKEQIQLKTKLEKDLIQQFKKDPVFRRAKIELESCLCEFPIFKIEGQGVGSEGGITLAQGNNGVNGLGGGVDYNYIFQLEGNVSPEVSQIIGDYPNCFNEDNKLSRECLSFVNSVSNESTVVVAILDSGLSLHGSDRGVLYDHSDDPPVCGIPEQYLGYNFAYDNLNTNDDNGHGSVVAYSYLSALNEMTFSRSNQAILPVKVLDNCGRGQMYDVICGMYYAAIKEADIVNLSLGCTADTEPLSLKEAIEYLDSKNISIVCSAGNDSLQLDNEEVDGFYHYPSAFFKEFSNTYEIAAICKNPHEITNTKPLWQGSNHREGSLAAAGIDFQVLFSIPIGNPNISTTGTSFAAPVVSGLLAKRIYNSEPISGMSFYSHWDDYQNGQFFYYDDL